MLEGRSFDAHRAAAVQSHIATIPEQTRVVGGDGNSDPLTETEMEWFVDFFQKGESEVVSL